MSLRNMIFFPHRGDPPPEQPPYVRDVGDPFTFILPWVECKYRKDEPACGGCGSTSSGQASCKKFDCLTDRVRCHTCEVEDKM